MSFHEFESVNNAPASSAGHGTKTPATAMIGFIFSLVGFLAVTAIAGIVLGIVGLRSAKQRGKGSGLAWAAIIIGGVWLVILAIIAGVSQSEESSPQVQSPEAPGQVVEEASEDLIAVPEETLDALEDMPVEPDPAPEPDPITPAQEFSGTGDKILQFESGPFIATITHRGNSNFAVWAMNDALEDVDLLVNEIGSYKGQVLGPMDSYGGLRITADGKWTVSVIPAFEAPRESGSVRGSGDAVFYWSGAGRSVARIQHNGSSNFAVWLYTSNGRDLLVNEIGPYDGEQIIQEGIFQITADGDWLLAPE